MNASDTKRTTSISRASSIEQISDYWDTHSLADHWDQTHEVEMDVKVIRRHRVTLDPEVFAQMEAQSRSRGIRTETLVNSWLRERLAAK